MTSMPEAAARYLPPRLPEPLDEPATVAQATSHLQAVLRAVTTYLPDTIVQARLAAPASAAVQGHFREATLMFADIAGFTAMSEQLSQLGREGAEIITAIVNDYSATMLAIAASHGGDLLKFGGDALLLGFFGADGAADGCHAALAMQQAMDRFRDVQTQRGHFSLRMTVGLGRGLVFSASLGTPERLEFAVMGPGLAQMARAEDLAEAGEVIIDEATRAAAGAVSCTPTTEPGFFRLNSAARGDPRPAPARLPLRADLPWLVARLDALAPYLPADILDPLILAPPATDATVRGPAVEGEHRLATVLFANFYGIDELIAALGPARADELTELLNAHLTAMQALVTSYGGIVNKVDSYAVGYRIMAVFGAPRAHEDDPARAVRAALEMQQAMARFAEVPTSTGTFTLKQRIGINTGFVFAGTLGAAWRREYTVMGDEVNLASRLMGLAADGEVRISAATAQQVGELFELEPQAPVSVKGKAAAVVTYRVAGVGAQARRAVAHSRLVGRARELATAQARLDGALRGHGHLLLISGEAGVGKSRLIEELSHEARRAGLTLLRGEALSYSRGVPYLPWLPLFRHLFGVGEGGDATQRREALLATLAQAGLAVWAPIAAQLFDVEIPDNEVTAALEPRLRRERFLDLVLQLVQAQAARCPLFIVLDDMHWADGASTDLLLYVARNLAASPVLLCVLHRTESEVGGPLPWVTACRELEHATRLALTELDAAESHELMRALLHDEPVTEEFGAAVLARAQGNPLFLEQVVLTLVETSMVRPDESGALALRAPLDAASVPTTLQGLLMSRMDRLPQVSRRVMQVAAVVGRAFTPPPVERVYPYGDLTGELPPLLDALVTHDLLLPGPREPVAEYLFKHTLTHEVAYGSLAYTLRRDLHRRVGAYIEATHSQSLAEHYATLARHFDEGQVWEKAFRYAVRAGDTARAEYANEAALNFYARAMEIAAREPLDGIEQMLIDLREAAGDVCALISRYSEALDHFQAAIALPGCPPRRQADLWRKVAESHEAQGNYDEALACLERGRAILAGDSDCLEGARLLTLMGWIRMRQGAFGEAWALCEEGIAIIRQLPPTPQAAKDEAVLCSTMGSIHLKQGNYDTAEEYYLRSATLNKEANNLPGVSIAQNNLAAVSFYRNDHQRAVAYIRESLAIDRKIGDISGVAMGLNNLGVLYFQSDQHAQAIESYWESNRLRKRIGDAWGIAQTSLNLGEVFLAQGEHRLARQYLTIAYETFRRLDSRSEQGEVFRLLAEVALAEGDTSAALAHAEEALAIATEAGNRQNQGTLHRLRGAILSAAGADAAALDAFQESIALFEEAENEREVGQSHLALGRALARHPTCQAEARDHLERALACFEAAAMAAEAESARAAMAELDRATEWHHWLAH